MIKDFKDNIYCPRLTIMINRMTMTMTMTRVRRRRVSFVQSAIPLGLADNLLRPTQLCTFALKQIIFIQADVVNKDMMSWQNYLKFAHFLKQTARVEKPPLNSVSLQIPNEAVSESYQASYHMWPRRLTSSA